MTIQLAYTERGTGFPLILLHGNGESSAYFANQIVPLAQVRRVIAVDTRGHGASPRGSAPFTLSQFADDLLAFMDRLGIAQADMLGFSDGGNIALLFALRHPVRRNEIADQIAIARGFGDLSENAEYDEAKNEQSRIEAKIVEMENTLRNCIVIDDDDVTTDTIGVGNTVKVTNQTLKKEQTFTIVGANETNPREMRISSESPIGSMLLGKKVGQVVSIDTPGGMVKMKVLEITR